VAIAELVKARGLSRQIVLIGHEAGALPISRRACNWS
jgi:hypothetical protein